VSSGCPLITTRMVPSISISRTQIQAPTREANWLPAPKGVPISPWPLCAESDALTGKWNPPAVMRRGADFVAGAIDNGDHSLNRGIGICHASRPLRCGAPLDGLIKRFA